jgi:hypothetical protein
MPLPEGGLTPLTGGTYALDLDTPGSDRYPDVVMTVPDTGWERLDGGLGVGWHDMAVSVWDVDKVFTRPCIGKVKVQPGPTVGDLAQAFEAAQLRHATEPTDIQVDGVHGQQIQWSVPRHIDLSACDDGYFDSWTGAKHSETAGCCRWQQGPGQVDRLWIFGVDGARLVIDAAYMPSADAADRQELFAVVDSIRFAPSSP